MQQLSAHDARFVYADNSHANANVTLIHIYDQSTAPGGHVRFKSILTHVESRLSRSPVFRRRLLRVPLDLDHPYWIDDEHFDLEYHVRHIALPKPGDWRQFCIQVSRIHARALDFDRPLWEIYVIEGLDGFADLPAGSFALVAKTHHAAIHLEQGSSITELLHDAVDGVRPPPPPEPWFPARAPRSVRLLSRGLARTVTAPLRMAGPLWRMVGQVAPVALGWAGGAMRRHRRLPPTRFNAVVSSHRVFETRRFALSEFKEIRRLVPGSTTNDVVLAVCGGGLRRYLDMHGELPARSLAAIAPISLRRSGVDPSQSRSELSWLQVQLGTEVGDPVARLRLICEQTAASATVARAVRARDLTDLERHTPAATLALASKMLAGAQLTLGRRAPLANCTVANVPGPEVPLYLCGARLTYFSAMLPITDGMGLVFAVTSYDGRIIVSPTSCRELMPDPQDFAQHVRDSFEEYLALARSRPIGAAEVAVKASRARRPASSGGRASRRVPTG